jgi:formate hydrogenlyase subunit 6/NADH:ubiquinone oxidoreductase subunit I
MDLDSFVEGPLFWIVSLVFLLAVAARLAFFISKIIVSSRGKESGVAYALAIFGRFLLPFHKAVPKKPLYAALRYIFHGCLFVVPVWLSGHISLWEMSRFEWSWTSLPSAWADGMTLTLLFIAGYFIIRRVASPRLRSDSSTRDFLVIIFAGLPFLTGYFLAHGAFEEIPFLAENMRLIHVLSAEAMILMAVFLFCRTRLNPRTCTGCASCELSCPTGTLETKDSGILRIFKYSHYQCICCGACVNTCPEDAAELRHEISLKRFFQIIPKQEIRSVEMKACQKCGTLFVPEPLFDKIGLAIKDQYLLFCPNCRKTNTGDLYRRLAPWARKPVLTARP